MAVRLSEQDRKELERYNRNFVQKAIQIIVQSRCGEKCKYTTKENGGLEWFSLPIPDNVEITSTVRKTLGPGPVLLHDPVNVEISLKRNESNGYIFLEVWSVALDTDARDPDVKISSGVYNRMTQALKAVLVVTRVTNAYRVAQRQKEDDYQIHYQVSVGLPNVDLLGQKADVKSRLVGSASTPLGTIRIHLNYTNSPRLLANNNNRQALMCDFKDDHFSHPLTTTYSLPKPCNRKFRNPKSVEDLRNLESIERQDVFAHAHCFSTSPPEGFSPPLPRISEVIMSGNQENESSTRRLKEKSPADADPFKDLQSSAFYNGPKIQLERPEDSPFAALMSGLPKPSDDTDSNSDTEDKDEKKNGEEKEEEDEDEDFSDASENLEAAGGGGGYKTPTGNDFEMLPPLTYSFADNTPSADPRSQLGHFYREMQFATQKNIGGPSVSVGKDFVDNIIGQISKYEEEDKHHSDFLKSIAQQEEELSDT